MGARVYIMTDLEGVAGVVLEEQTRASGGAAYQQARHWLTAEVNAVAAGAFEAGAEYVLAVDGHGEPFNFVYTELDPRLECIVGSGWDKYPEGITDEFDCAFLVGMHAKAGTPHAVLDHTMSSLTWQNCWINDQLSGELAIVAGVLGEHDVPVTLVSGDLACCNEARELLGPQVELVVTKYGISRNAGRLRAQQPVIDELKAGAQAALQQLDRANPLVFSSPVNLKIEYTKTKWADGLKATHKARPEARLVEVKGATLEEAFLNLN